MCYHYIPIILDQNEFNENYNKSTYVSVLLLFITVDPACRPTDKKQIINDDKTRYANIGLTSAIVYIIFPNIQR